MRGTRSVFARESTCRKRERLCNIGNGLCTDAEGLCTNWGLGMQREGCTEREYVCSERVCVFFP